MLHNASGSRFPLHWLRFPRLRLTWSHIWRCSLVALMLLTYVAGMWAGIVSPGVAHAAALSQQRTLLVPSSTKPARRGTYASSISPCPALTGTPEIEGDLDGLGTLSTYTFVKHNADDRLLMETNVINGNLVAQYSALQIQGTGLNLDITLTYNAQTGAAPGVLGANWNLSVGNGVSLSFTGANANFYGPSGFKLPFEADSNSYGGYAEPPGLDATLLNSTVNGASHVLIFQHTSECLGFNGSGQEIFDQDKNGHQITFAYNSSGNLTGVTDTQNRLTSFGYDGSGRINLITDPISRTVQLGYDSNNNLTSIIDLNGKTTTLGYTAAPHDLTSIATPVSGHTTAIHYQSSGNRVNQITDALSNNTYMAYYSPGVSQCGAITTLACSTFKDANNHTTIYGSDDLQVKAVLDGNGNMASTSYTPMPTSTSTPTRSIMPPFSAIKPVPTTCPPSLMAAEPPSATTMTTPIPTCPPKSPTPRATPSTMSMTVMAISNRLPIRRQAVLAPAPSTPITPPVSLMAPTSTACCSRCRMAMATSRTIAMTPTAICITSPLPVLSVSRRLWWTP